MAGILDIVVEQCRSPVWYVQGFVNVAAVDCDDASNRPLCGEYGVNGFPTIKVWSGSNLPELEV